MGPLEAGHFRGPRSTWADAQPGRFRQAPASPPSPPPMTRPATSAIPQVRSGSPPWLVPEGSGGRAAMALPQAGLGRVISADAPYPGEHIDRAFVSVCRKTEVLQKPAMVSGTRGSKFESSRPDQHLRHLSAGRFGRICGTCRCPVHHSSKTTENKSPAGAGLCCLLRGVRPEGRWAWRAGDCRPSPHNTTRGRPAAGPPLPAASRG